MNHSGFKVEITPFFLLHVCYFQKNLHNVVLPFVNQCHLQLVHTFFSVLPVCMSTLCHLRQMSRNYFEESQWMWNHFLTNNSEKSGFIISYCHKKWRIKSRTDQLLTLQTCVFVVKIVWITIDVWFSGFIIDYSYQCNMFWLINIYILY